MNKIKLTPIQHILELTVSHTATLVNTCIAEISLDENWIGEDLARGLGAAFYNNYMLMELYHSEMDDYNKKFYTDMRDDMIKIMKLIDPENYERAKNAVEKPNFDIEIIK